MKCRREAFALAIVLWIVAALLLGIAFLGALSRDTLDLTTQLQQKLEARQKARSLLSLLKYYILTAKYDSVSLYADLNASGMKLPSRLVLDGRSYTLSDGSKIALSDLSSKINVFLPDFVLISKLLSIHEKNILRYTISDSIQDWTDRDDSVRLNGAEEAYYRLVKRVPYRPRNNPGIQSVNELRLIRGVSDLSTDRWNLYKNRFYAKERGSSYNLALVDKQMLQSLLGLNFLEASTLERYRKKNIGKFIDYLSSLKNYNDEYMGFSLSFAFRIRIETRVGKARSRLETLIDFRGPGKRIVTYRYRIN